MMIYKILFLKVSSVNLSQQRLFCGADWDVYWEVFVAVAICL